MSTADIRINSELDKLNSAIAMYARASGKTMAQAVEKKSRDLGFALAAEAKGLMPAKNAVRAERLAALKAGEGIHVRATAYRDVEEKYHLATDLGGRTVMARGKKRVKLSQSILVGGKRLNLQALAVKRELAIRESGRGFLSHSERLGIFSPGENRAVNRIQRSISRYGPSLGEFAFTANAQNASAIFKWGGFSELSNEAVKAMGRSRGQAAIARAVKSVTDDMAPYLERKLGEAAVGLLK